MRSGWFGDRHRHYLAAKGIKTVKVYHGTATKNLPFILKSGELRPNNSGKIFVSTNPSEALIFGTAPSVRSSEVQKGNNRLVDNVEYEKGGVFETEVPVNELEWSDIRGKSLGKVGETSGQRISELEDESRIEGSGRYLTYGHEIPVSKLKVTTQKTIDSGESRRQRVIREIERRARFSK